MVIFDRNIFWIRVNMRHKTREFHLSYCTIVHFSKFTFQEFRKMDFHMHWKCSWKIVLTESMFLPWISSNMDTKTTRIFDFGQIKNATVGIRERGVGWPSPKKCNYTWFLANWEESSSFSRWQLIIISPILMQAGSVGKSIWCGMVEATGSIFSVSFLHEMRS